MSPKRQWCAATPLRAARTNAASEWWLGSTFYRVARQRGSGKHCDSELLAAVENALCRRVLNPRGRVRLRRRLRLPESRFRDLDMRTNVSHRSRGTPRMP
jgi:hypothetical protein